MVQRIRSALSLLIPPGSVLPAALERSRTLGRDRSNHRRDCREVNEKKLILRSSGNCKKSSAIMDLCQELAIPIPPTTGELHTFYLPGSKKSLLLIEQTPRLWIIIAEVPLNTLSESPGCMRVS